MAAETRVTVYREGIQSHFAPGGGVQRNAIEVGTQSAALAKARAPRRTGRLAAGVHSNGGIMGRFSYIVTVQITGVPYAKYVLGGTMSPIFPTRSKHLHLPPGGGYPGLRLYRVRGQRPNQFLADAVSEILRRHGYPVVFV